MAPSLAAKRNLMLLEGAMWYTSLSIAPASTIVMHLRIIFTF